ncbi:ABC transporter ATP-binding protein [Streptomyces sp. AJS327]|uniref:ABC transporter ATP-binding protein n=1 Tax=Streptomyces sp. AJS327 TaxID=2545265 RepID=UPI0015DEE89B|nr:ABC transporter ATP-binding protein [Streptomyces sp. AJS327]MBA0052520.1 ABC transporter ATP-binding protein [Streptomyces sp. AJS327]
MIELNGIGYRYTPGRWVFRDVHATAREGRVLAVLGPNGRGKTTLLRCAAGLLKPSAGTVRATRPVAYVPQSHGAALSYSVADMVLMGRTRHLRAYATPGERDRRRAAEALDRVGIAHLAPRIYTELSGGERQLTLIARALAAHCRILVLDEPASALDLRNQARVHTLLGELADEGMGVVLTTHHPDHALHLADDALLVFGPDDVRCGPREELLTGPVLSELYQVPLTLAEVATERGPRTVVASDLGPPRTGAHPDTPHGRSAA